MFRDWMRTGEYRICPQCEARNKVTEPSCVQCGRALFGIPPSQSVSPPDETGGARTRSGSWVRVALVAGVMLAIGFGLFVRKTFRGATLEPNAQAQNAAPPDPAPRPAPDAVTAPTPPPPTARDYERGRALLERGDARGALRVLTPVAQAAPDNAVIAHTYGRALWAAGSRDRAIVQFERAARIDPHMTVYRADLGKSLAASRRIREAIREYEAALSLDPGNADTVQVLAGLYARAGDHAESRALLERAAMLRPGDAALAQRLADNSQAMSYTPSNPTAVPAVSASSAASASSLSAASGSAHVYTEDDLRRAGTGRTPGSVAPRPPPPIVRADSQSLGEDESKWREKATERREAVRSSEQLVATYKARVAHLQRLAEGQGAAEPDSERELEKAREELESAQERLARAERRLDELQDDARRKSVPSDWIR
jgi:Flp pilus assembly protein TadD